MRSGFRLTMLGLLLAGTCALQGWFDGIGSSGAIHRESRLDLVDAYAQALANGSAAVSPTGPWDTAGRTKSLVDTSYFKGRYYVYYGIVPFALVLVPWLKLTHTFLSSEACILGALLLGYAAYGLALAAIFRRKNQPAVDALMLLGFLTIVLASKTWPLLDLPQVHEMESAWAFAMTACSAASLTFAWSFDRFRWAALLGASLFAGLAVGCRPDCAPSAAVAAGLSGCLAWLGTGDRRGGIAQVLFSQVPFLCVLAALAAWNFCRFGSWTEFGMHYGTGALGSPRIVAYSAANMPYNLHRYLLGGIRWGHYFPFIDGMRAGPFALPTASHEPMDQVYGCLITAPVLLLGGFAFVRRPLMALCVLAAAVGNLAILLGLGFGTYRYPVDFAGLFAFLGAIGIVSTAELGSRWARGATWALSAALLFATAGLCLCEAVSVADVHRLFDLKRPEDNARIARPFNSLAYRLEPVLGTSPSKIQVDVLLPSSKFAHDEPIVVTGEPGSEDFLYFYYQGPGAVQIGFESMGHGGPLSRSFAVDYSKRHTLEIFMGSMLPPDDHPLLAPLGAPDIAKLRKLLRVTMDGKPILEAQVPFHSIRSRIYWGSSPDDASFGAAFTGTLFEVSRPAMGPKDLHD